MVGAFDLAEVLWKHKSCESPLRAALIGQACRRDRPPPPPPPPPPPRPPPPPPPHPPPPPPPLPNPTLTLYRRCAAGSG